MNLHIGLDRIANQLPGTTNTVASGQLLSIVGWAIDLASGTAPDIVGRLDGCVTVRATRRRRSDVADNFGNSELSQAGFVLDFDLEIVPGAHTIAIGTEENGAFFEGLTLAITAVESVGLTTVWPRIIVAGALKSGSTFTHTILGRYFNAPPPPLRGYHIDWGFQLDAWARSRMRDRAFVAHMHLKPYKPNVAAMRELGIVPVVTWRNIADALVSLDDHFRRELPEEGPAFLWFVESSEAYRALPAHERYDLLIRYTAPWYVDFFLGWRTQPERLAVHYEWLATDPLAYFSHVVERIAGSVDIQRLQDILSQGTSYTESRRNLGVNGRAAAMMSAGNRALLEDLLKSGPFAQNLDELIRELPWNDGPAAVVPRPATAAAARGGDARNAGTHSTQICL